MSKVLLKMENISKSFGRVKALKKVNLEVIEGEIHAIVGENGAGKSTLMNILSGVYPFGSYEGNIYYNDEVVKFHNIKESEKKGIVIIHQELALIPDMTIAENMFLGNEIGKSFSIDWIKTFNLSKKYMKKVGLKEKPGTLVKDLGVGKQQLLEIAKALVKNAKLLILDEPTASLNEDDSKALLELLLEFKKQGVTSIIISHKLNEIEYVADKITVIRDGSTIETLNNKLDKIDQDRIIKGMVGRTLTDRFPKRKESKIGNTILEVKDMTVYHPLFSEIKIVDNVSLKLKKGEILGICGLMGSGRTELAMSIFGKSYTTNVKGKIYLEGNEVRIDTIQDAIKHKIAYVTEDRKGNGLILSDSIKINTTLANISAISKNGIIDNDNEINIANKYIKDLKTKCNSVEQKVGNLSGGNQQKVLLSKWMFLNPDILILDEPTRGIDVGAKYEIYTIINKLISQGKSVIMISSELPEVLGMSDRIYIMNKGKILGELPASEATQEKIMSYILNADKGVI